MTSLRRGSIDALERELAALVELVNELAAVPLIVTRPEARAVRRFLVAHARGQADAFWRRQKHSAALVATVTARRGVAWGEREGAVSGSLSAQVG